MLACTAQAAGGAPYNIAVVGVCNRMTLALVPGERIASGYFVGILAFDAARGYMDIVLMSCTGTASQLLM